MFAYNKSNGKKVKRQKSPLEETVYLMPANSTTIAPPEFDEETQLCYFDDTNEQWAIEQKISSKSVEKNVKNLYDDIPNIELLRSLRDSKLKEVDYITLRAYSKNESVPPEWSEYMQKLRDITKDYPNPEVEFINGGFRFTNVIWPKKPE